MVQDMNKRSLSTSSFRENLTFFVKLLFFGLLFGGYILHVIPQYSGSLVASLIDKVDRIESINEPKIVLLGHSNLAFGIDSKLIEENIGMPVVNMGLHGGIGNAFHENMAKLNVTEGDIYIICHSDYADADTIRDAVLVWTAIEDHFELWRLLRPKDIGPMIEAFPIYFKKALNLYAAGTGNNIWGSRSAYNEYGDIATIRTERSYTFYDVMPPSINDTTTERINELNQWLKDRGATLLIASYPIGNGELTADAQEYIDFQEELKAGMDCPVISNYVDYMFDYSYFYDTELHLNNAGTELRTRQLIADINNWMSAESGEEDADILKDDYTDIVGDVSLSHISDMEEYLSALQKGKERYCIFISAQGDTLGRLDTDTVNELGELGLTVLFEEPAGTNYAALIDGNNISEHAGDKLVKMDGEAAQGSVSYEIVSGGADYKCTSSVLINGKEYLQDLEGFNIVVYSVETKRVLDAVCFNLSSETLNWSAVRAN